MFKISVIFIFPFLRFSNIQKEGATDSGASSLKQASAADCASDKASRLETTIIEVNLPCSPKLTELENPAAKSSTKSSSFAFDKSLLVKPLLVTRRLHHHPSSQLSRRVPRKTFRTNSMPDSLSSLLTKPSDMEKNSPRYFSDGSYSYTSNNKNLSHEKDSTSYLACRNNLSINETNAVDLRSNFELKMRSCSVDLGVKVTGPRKLQSFQSNSPPMRLMQNKCEKSLDCSKILSGPENRSHEIACLSSVNDATVSVHSGCCASSQISNLSSEVLSKTKTPCQQTPSLHTNPYSIEISGNTVTTSSQFTRICQTKSIRKCRCFTSDTNINLIVFYKPFK